MTAATTGPDGTLHWRLPLAKGDPAGVRRLADAYAGLADVVARELRVAAVAGHELDRSWTGAAAVASASPERRIETDGVHLVGQLRRTTDDLDRYAAELARAQEHHGWSLSRLAALGAVIVVTGAAAVVTMGAAAAVAGTADAAVAEGAAEGATAAAASATAAEEGAAAELSSAGSAIAGLQPLSEFLLPHLLSAELGAGASAGVQVVVTGRISAGQVEGAALVGFAGSMTADNLAETTAPYLSQAPAALQRLAPTLLEGGLWGGASGLEDLLDGQPITARDLIVGATSGMASSAARDARQAWSDARAAAIARSHDVAARVSEQLLAGEPRLDEHEDRGGHTLARHVHLSVGKALARLVGPHAVAFSSLFRSRAVADTAIAQALVDNRPIVARWLAAGGDRLVITSRFRGGFAGVVFCGSPEIGTHVERVTVVLDRPHGIPRIRTAYPLFTDPTTAAAAAAKGVHHH